MALKNGSPMISSAPKQNKKAPACRPELEIRLLESNIFGLNFTPKTGRRQRLADHINRIKRRMLHRSAYLTYQGGVKRG